MYSKRFKVLYRPFINISGRMQKYTLKPGIVLSDKEKTIFGVLRDAAGRAGKPVVLRVAGGWVRDKVEMGFTQASWT